MSYEQGRFTSDENLDRVLSLRGFLQERLIIDLDRPRQIPLHDLGTSLALQQLPCLPDLPFSTITFSSILLQLLSGLGLLLIVRQLELPLGLFGLGKRREALLKLVPHRHLAHFNIPGCAAHHRHFVTGIIESKGITGSAQRCLADSERRGAGTSSSSPQGGG